jgi:hypothetical protein
VDRDFISDYRTHYSKNIAMQNGFNFKIDLKLKFEANASVFDSSIGVIIQTWHGEEVKCVVNPDHSVIKERDY